MFARVDRFRTTAELCANVGPVAIIKIEQSEKASRTSGIITAIKTSIHHAIWNGADGLSGPSLGRRQEQTELRATAITFWPDSSILIFLEGGAEYWPCA